MIKLSKSEVRRRTKNPLVVFREGIRSDVTRKRYERKLQVILCDVLEDHLSGDFNQRVKEFVEKTKADPDWTMDLMLAFSSKLKERTKLPDTDPDYLNPQSFPNYFKPIKKLFKMNGVHFEWARVNTTFPELDNDNETRGYTRKEISKILEFSTTIDKVIVLLASSAGIRRGGLDMTWDCIKPIYKNEDGRLKAGKFNDEDDREPVCGMVDIYKNSAYHYVAFFSSECWYVIKNYQIEWKSDALKHPKEKDPFLKQQGPFVKALNGDAAANRIFKILHKSKLRNKLTNGKRRHEVPVMNGFRRFWNKTVKESIPKTSALASLIRTEYMMGHTGLIKLDKNYFKTNWMELAEEYSQAVPNLTISNEEREKAKALRLEKKVSELEEKDNRIQFLEKKWDKTAKDLQIVLDAMPILAARNDPKKQTQRIKEFSEKYKLQPGKTMNVSISLPKGLRDKIIQDST